MQNAALNYQPERSLPRLVEAGDGLHATRSSVGEFRLAELLARGGMADVHLASDRHGRLVVVKQVLAKLDGVERYRELLRGEAALATHLRHPNVVRGLQAGDDAAGAPYIAFEYVEGVDLRQLLRLCTRRKIPLQVPISLHVVREVLRALEHAHRARDAHGRPLAIVHRDVTPSNVLLGFDGDVKLCDFGIASAHCMPAVPNDRVEGKTGYMSPEHARGLPLDKKSDLYSVGIMLWEMLAGRRMRSNQPEVAFAAAKRGEVPPFPLRGLPEEALLHGIVGRALARPKKQRFASAGAMLRELDDYCQRAGFEVTAPQLGAWLQSVLAPECEESAQRRQRVALQTASIEPDEVVEETPAVGEVDESGPRLVRHAVPAPVAAPSVSPPATQAALLICAAVVMLLGVLRALGMI